IVRMIYMSGSFIFVCKFSLIMSSSIPINPVELWRPKDISNTEIEKFRIKVNEKYNINLGTQNLCERVNSTNLNKIFFIKHKIIENYQQLWQWSVDNIQVFWAEVWDYTKIIYSVPY